MVGIDGTRPTIVADHPAGQHAPRWAPDGRRIAFVSRRRGWSQAWVVDAPLPRRGPRPVREQRPEPRALTPSGIDVDDLQWSPDGLTIAVLAQRDPDLTTTQVTIVDVAGGDERIVAGAGHGRPARAGSPTAAGCWSHRTATAGSRSSACPSAEAPGRPSRPAPVDHGDYLRRLRHGAPPVAGRHPVRPPGAPRRPRPPGRGTARGRGAASVAARAGRARSARTRRPGARGPDRPLRRGLARRRLAARRERDPRHRLVASANRRTSGSSRSPGPTAPAAGRGA